MHLMKNYKMALSLLAMLFLIVLSSFVSNKTRIDEYTELGGWVKLGTQTVSPGVDYDELNITDSDETFKHLKFKVSKAPVYIWKIYVMYSDDTSEGHVIKRHFKKGDASRILDLVGYERKIKKIIFNYTRRNTGKQQAELVVMAKL